jgi:serine protease AprX
MIKRLIQSDLRNEAHTVLPVAAGLADLRKAAAGILRPSPGNLLLTALALIAAVPGFAGPKLAPDLAGNGRDMVEVIVQYKTVPTGVQLDHISARGQVKHIFNHIRAVHASLPLRDVEALESDPSVVYISPDRTVSSAANWGSQNNGSSLLDMVGWTANAPSAWSAGLDGSGVGVAIIDSGVTQKDDLMTANGSASRIVYSQSFVPGQDPTDLYGHGTHVSGIVGGNGADSSGNAAIQTFRGIAPNVNIIDLKVLDQTGSGQASAVIAAIEQAIDLQGTYNVRVINLSLGQPVYESYTQDPLCQAAEQAWAAGIVVVTAAGNYGRDNSQGTNGYATITSPGNDPYVITVGATDMHNTPFRFDDTVASYSSKGPSAIDHVVKPDLIAPGNSVISLLASPTCTLVTTYPSTQIPVSTYQYSWGQGSWGSPQLSTNYFRLSGTSMAAPVVSGAAALLLQNQPSLTPDQVKARLMKTASKSMASYSTDSDSWYSHSYGYQADIFTVGAGYLDINAALKNTDLATAPALSAVASFNSSTGLVTIGRNLSVSWGSSVTWGDSVVWGTAVFVGTSNGFSVVWGDSVVWGNAVSSGFSVVWGDSLNFAAMQAASPADGDN